MVTPRDVATGSAHTITANGQEWRITPMTEGQWGQYQAWLKDQYLDVVQRNAGKIEDAETRQAVIRDAFTRVGRLELDSPEMVALTNSPAGLYRLIREHLLPCHPDITEAKVAEILNSPEIQKLFLLKIKELAGPQEVRKKKSPAKRRKKRKVSRAKKRR